MASIMPQYPHDQWDKVHTKSTTFTVPVPQFNLASTLLNRGIGFGPQFSFFEELLKSSQAQAKYPPYDLVTTGEDSYELRFALAGFSKKDISVTLQNNVLTIDGQGIDSLLPESELDYIHHGIAKRDFKQSFPLAEHIEVVAAEMADGVLTVKLERNLPEELQPKTIKIK